MKPTFFSSLPLPKLISFYFISFRLPHTNSAYKSLMIGFPFSCLGSTVYFFLIDLIVFLLLDFQTCLDSLLHLCVCRAHTANHLHTCPRFVCVCCSVIVIFTCYTQAFFACQDEEAGLKNIRWKTQARKREREREKG